MKNIEITSSFWRRYRELIVKEVLPYQWTVMNDEADIAIAHEPGGNEADSKNSHAIANLKIAAGQASGHHFGYPFQDTDVYKWLEAAAYSFKYHPDTNLREITDNLIDLIAEAQDEDGYLSTFFQIEAPERKFKRLKQSHELYTMGHYIEAGITYYQATDNKKALDIAIKMANCIDNNFGLTVGKIHGVDGHPEIELALMRLYDETQDSKYLALTKFFINQRGQDPEFFDDQIRLDGIDNDLIDGMKGFPNSYYQAGEPIVDQETAEGHAVRVVYLCTGMAHLARETGDKELLAACRRFWDDIVQKRMYITGGIGSTNIGESFTYDYDLPNDTMYGETCASVGMAFFAKQMLGIEAKGEYGDVLEKELFNGTLSGMSLDGQHFFYVNPLEADPVISKNNPSRSHVLTQRADWFGCACCPSNVARLIASVDTYIYHEEANVILSDQFIANKAEFDNDITIEQNNNFPWDGDIQYHLTNPNNQSFKFGIRIPGWSQTNYQVTVDGKPIKSDLQDGFIYFNIDGTELDIQLMLDMSAKFMQANELVRYDFGKVSVQRGPIVYCAEEIDNEAPLWKYRIDIDSKFEEVYQETMLNGMVQLNVKATRSNINGKQILYSEYSRNIQVEGTLKLIPYYAWANRDDGQMLVWLNH